MPSPPELLPPEAEGVPSQLEPVPPPALRLPPTLSLCFLKREVYFPTLSLCFLKREVNRANDRGPIGALVSAMINP